MSSANDDDDDDDDDGDAGGIAVLVGIYSCGLVEHVLVMWRSGVGGFVRHCGKGRIIVPDRTHCILQTHTASCRHTHCSPQTVSVFM